MLVAVGIPSLPRALAAQPVSVRWESTKERDVGRSLLEPSDTLVSLVFAPDTAPWRASHDAAAEPLPPRMQLRSGWTLPENVLFGAVVGGVVGYYLSTQDSDDLSVFYLVPVGAFLGGFAFWAAGIELPFGRW